LLLLFLGVAALAVRGVGIEDPPLEFAASRQYRSALIARAMYREQRSDAPTPQDLAARASRMREGLLEPPVLETVAASLYRLGGGERLWMPRALNALAWVAAGFALYVLAAGMTGRPGGIVAAAWFWFLPFTVPASRSLQPDVWMVALSIFAFVGVWRWERGRKRWLIAAAALSGAAATLIKPTAALFVLGSWLGLRIQGRGWRRALRGRGTWVFAAFVVLPSLGYLGWQLAGGGRIGGQAASSFIPALLLQASTWRGWLRLLGEVIGYVPLVAAVAGVLILRDRSGRSLLLGALAGYGLYGLAFSYHIHTHDYYHLPLIPLVALALAPVGQLVLEEVGDRARSVGIQVALVLLAVGLSASVVLVARPGPRDGGRRLVERAVRVGKLVDHTEHAILLAPHLGKPLQYHGELSGTWWPRRGMLREERIRGQAERSSAERLEAILRAEPEMEYFIITDMAAWADQPELRRLLDEKFEAFSKAEDHVIYRLR
jgi:hypothetical protein